MYLHKHNLSCTDWSLMSAESRTVVAGRHTGSGTNAPGCKTALTDGLTLDRRRSELAGISVVEVEIRERPRSSRCALAPHAAEVSIFRKESRYHRLVLTMADWLAFLADVKAGHYDVATTPWL